MKRLLVALTLLSALAASAQTAPTAAGVPPAQQPRSLAPATPPSAPPPAAAPNALGAQGQPNANATFRNDSEFRGDSEFRRGPRGTQVVLTREELEQHLARVEELLGKAIERSRRWEGRGLLNDAHKELNDLRDLIENAPEARGGYGYPGGPRQPPPPPPPAYRPVSDGRLASILEAMSRESFARDKLNVIQSAATGDAYFLVEQVHQVLGQFQFSKDRLTVVRGLWPRVLDKQNGYMLNNDFQFSNDKEELKRIISGG